MLHRINQKLAADPHGALSLIVRLLQENGRLHWRRYAFVLFCMTITAACTAAAAYLIGQATNEAYVSRSFSGIATVAVAIMVTYMAKGISTYCQAVELAKIGNYINADNQRRVFDKLIRQDLSYFSDRHSSEFISRISYGSGAAANVLRLLVTTLGRDVMTLIALAAIMIMQAPMLSLIAIVVMVPSILFVRHLITRVRSIAQAQFLSGTRILKSLQETMQGLRVVKALNLEDEMRRRLDEDTRELERNGNKLARVVNRSAPVMDSLAGVAVGLVMMYGGYRIMVINEPPGQFVSFVAAFLLAYEPVKRLSRLNIDVTSALVGVRFLFEIFDLPQSAGNDRLPSLQVAKGGIEFKDVVFEYKPSTAVLRGLSFVAEAGQITALVGPSGGGKTTIFNLLLRLYEPAGGKILIDRQDLSSVSRASVRSNIAYVGQDIFLFHGSIGANIAFGRVGAGEADVIEAAKAAHAHEFIMKLPAGYDTPVGEHGLQLSGGQRQRIAVARALIRNAPVILLDEPTGSLDSESEAHVQNAIRHLAEGRTTLVIAHRLNTVMDAGVIHVVEGGLIVESGNHDSLIRQGRRYADFYRLQFERQLQNGTDTDVVGARLPARSAAE